MTSLVILTSDFPYNGGEQFIEAEIGYWQNTQFNNVYILPSKKGDSVRLYPDKIKILEPEIDSTYLTKLKYVVLSLYSIYFWNEFFLIFFKSKKKGKIENLKVALNNCAIVLRYQDALESSLKKIDDKIFIYSYWNDYSYYAACILKKKGVVDKVISRTHGYDLYEQRRVNEYMPLKWQFRDVVDKIYVLSEKAKQYYLESYSYNQNVVDVARLGVHIPKEIKQFNVTQAIRILSISYCVPVKRLDRIINGIEEYLTKYPMQKIEWIHIGDGPLYDFFLKKVNLLESKYKLFQGKLLGQMSNVEVHDYLEKNYFDIFINTSESEGIPVSIMEAMSYGIPAIAGDIGGISELINNKTGYLMSSQSDPSEVVKGIESLYGENSYRVNSREHISYKFNAAINFVDFIHQLEQLDGFNE